MPPKKHVANSACPLGKLKELGGGIVVEERLGPRPGEELLEAHVEQGGAGEGHQDQHGAPAPSPQQKRRGRGKAQWQQTNRRPVDARAPHDG